MKKINLDMLRQDDYDSQLVKIFEDQLPEYVKTITKFECINELTEVRPNEYSLLKIYERDKELWCSFEWTLVYIREPISIIVHISESSTLTSNLMEWDKRNVEFLYVLDTIKTLIFPPNSDLKFSIDNFILQDITMDYLKEKLFQKKWTDIGYRSDFLFLKKVDSNIEKGILELNGEHLNNTSISKKLSFYVEDWNKDGLIQDEKYGLEKVWIDKFEIEESSENELRICYDFTNAWRHKLMFCEIFDIILKTSLITRVRLIAD